MSKNQPNLCTCTMEYRSKVSWQSVVSLASWLDSRFLHESKIENQEKVIENWVEDRVTWDRKQKIHTRHVAPYFKGCFTSPMVIYSWTSLQWPPWGQKKVAIVKRWKLWRGFKQESMYEFFLSIGTEKRLL